MERRGVIDRDRVFPHEGAGVVVRFDREPVRAGSPCRVIELDRVVEQVSAVERFDGREKYDAARREAAERAGESP